VNDHAHADAYVRVFLPFQAPLKLAIQSNGYIRP
jgi:hypothetical protein